MKKNILVYCSIILIICLSVGLFWYSFVSFLRPYRLNSLYNHVLNSVTKYGELLGYSVTDKYDWSLTEFNVLLTSDSKDDKLMVVSTNYLSQIKDVNLVPLSSHIDFDTVSDDVLKDSISRFNSIFTYTNIYNTPIKEVGYMIVNYLSNEQTSDIDLNIINKDKLYAYKDKLRELYKSYSSSQKGDISLEELESFNIFCSRLLSHDYFYDMNDNYIVLSISFDYKVNHEQLKLYLKDGVISCE